MGTARSHADTTSADTTALGFDYQYWFFLLRVLQLRSGESVGLEVADDVHTELNNDFQILFQLKHTVQRKADGSSENLTTFDSDFWKTMWNWSQVICDANAGRKSESSQLDFVSKTDFVLVSNKSRKQNTSIDQLFTVPANAKTTLEKLKKSTKDTTLERYIAGVLALKPKVLVKFLQNTRLDLEEDDLISKCETAIREKHVPDSRVKDVLRNVDSQMRQDNFSKVSNRQKVIITFEDFHKSYRSHFDYARSEDLLVRKLYDPLPESLGTQVFIQQLLEIRDFDINDEGEMAKLTRLKQSTENNLSRWQVDGEITGVEVDELDEESTTRWENMFKKFHRHTAASPADQATQLVDGLREVELSIRKQRMGIKFSNGQYYKLADLAQIGFLPGWKEKYRENSGT